MDNLAHNYLKDSAFMSQIRDLSKLQPVVFALHVAMSWTVIIGCFVLWAYQPSWWLWPVLALIISTRQHALGLLVHDVAHFRFLKNSAVGDFFCNILMAYPLMYNVQEYRRHHLNHHKYLNTNLDPDWMQKAGRPEYETPMPRSKLIKRLLWAAAGGGIYEMIRYMLFFYKKDMKKNTSNAAIKTWGLTQTHWMIVYNVSVVSTMFFFGVGSLYFILWLAPAFTILMGLLELRSLTEHIGFEEDETHYSKTRSVRVSWLEGFVLNPHNSHFHIEHHMFPSIPFYNLPKVHHALMATEEFSTKAQVAESYFGFGTKSVASKLSSVQSKAVGN